MRKVYAQTERLEIRNLNLHDAQTISSYRSKEEVAKYQSWGKYSIEDSKKLIQEMLNTKPSYKGVWYQFGIELISEKKLIGDIGFLNTDNEGKSWIGFTLDSDFWKKGYAYEAITEILKFYQELGIKSVWASIDPDNSPSKKLLEKLKFQIKDIEPDDTIFQLEFRVWA